MIGFWDNNPGCWVTAIRARRVAKSADFNRMSDRRGLRNLRMSTFSIMTEEIIR